MSDWLTDFFKWGSCKKLAVLLTDLCIFFKFYYFYYL